ncbi:hypothetical protein MSG28_006195 [Choristoneura fumiferana]|uniref:Uncharacterized protein n=1 Tax=Choristoneura fumiferana TaxID=7141 RepID=A0ACC0JDX6_CHOFU|nr:hypothetical protein MSG28_006195 [Choristoneura fumiferana]
MYRIPYLVLCLVAATHQHNITEFVVPDAVEVGGNAELVCEHDADGGVVVKWWWTRPGAEGPHQLYQRVDNAGGHLIAPHVDPPLNITLSGQDNNNIMLWNLQPQHSGEYLCEVTQNIVDERRSANDLVVYSPKHCKNTQITQTQLSPPPHYTELFRAQPEFILRVQRFSLGSGPLLNTTKFEGETDVQVTCEAVGVAPEPRIHITFDSKTFNTSALHGPIDGLYNVFANATVPEADLDGKEVFCDISFVLAIDVPTAMTEISTIYYSDAWLASSTTTAVPETTEAPTEIPEQRLRDVIYAGHTTITVMPIYAHTRSVLTDPIGSVMPIGR